MRNQWSISVHMLRRQWRIARRKAIARSEWGAVGYNLALVDKQFRAGIRCHLAMDRRGGNNE